MTDNTLERLEADANNRAFLRDPHRLEGFDWQAEQARDLETMRRRTHRKVMRLARLYAAARVLEEQATADALKLIGEAAPRWAKVREARARATDYYVALNRVICNLTEEAF